MSTDPGSWSSGAGTGGGGNETLLVDDAGELVPPQRLTYVPAPYEDKGELGVGGMGVVRLAYDPALRRDVALKVIREDLMNSPDYVARFETEAQITAQLEHPGIVPVHGYGKLEDGRAYFTMKQIRGRTLALVIKEVHQARVEGAWMPAQSGWTLRRLIVALHLATQAVAYAHSRGVVHRDIKPRNIMVGDFGEVLMLDWGIAKVLAEQVQPEDQGKRRRIVDDGHTSQTGELMGTPAYMSPEQANGKPDQVAPTTDVYGLGAVLYEILTGRPPYRGISSKAIVDKVLEGEPPQIPDGLPVPHALREICQRAMARQPADRFPDALAMADALRAWLEGAERRAHALLLVARADDMEPEVATLEEEAAVLHARADAALLGVAPHDPIERKEQAWNLEDLAFQKARAASLQELAYTQMLQSALNLDPELPEAHARLARHYQSLHRRAEEGRDPDAAARYEFLLRAHNRGCFSAYLAGHAALSLVTDPPGAEAVLYRFVPRQRRLVLEPVQDLGPTPLHQIPIQAGSYLLTLRAPGRATVRYPIFLRRGEHWDGVPPGATAPVPVLLPPEAEIGPDDLIVPAGWFWAGGDPGTLQSLPRRRLWVDAFVIRRFPVAVGEHLALLNRLVDAGRGEEALALAPRLRGPKEEEGGALMFGRNPEGRFFLRLDEDGDLWDPTWPMFLQTWHQARAVAATFAEQTGLPWRLPFELEREKAARGVDGRFFPWGDHYDPTYACNRDSRPGRPLPAPVDSFPVDESPCGARGMAGGVVDWCMDLYRPAGPRLDGDRALTVEEAAAGPDDMRAVRGGAYSFYETGAHAARRSSMHPSACDYQFGLRLARPL